MLTHRQKLLVIGAILVAALGATLLVNTPEPTRTIDEVMEDPIQHEGRQIAIRGEVHDGSINNEIGSFLIHGSDSQLLVDFSQALTSGGLDDNRTVYAEGVLEDRDGVWVFNAEIIKTSCPSKYEEAIDE